MRSEDLNKSIEISPQNVMWRSFKKETGDEITYIRYVITCGILFILMNLSGGCLYGSRMARKHAFHKKHSRLLDAVITYQSNG